MSNIGDTDGEGSGGHNRDAGVSPEDRSRLEIMISKLKGRNARRDEVEPVVFATVGSAVLAADTLRGMGYKVRHNVLAVEVERSPSP